MIANSGYVISFLTILCAVVGGQSAAAQVGDALKLTERTIQAAAEEGHSDAQLKLGRLYLAGLAMPRDRGLAYVWFNIAAANGSKAAVAERDSLEKLLTPGQVAQAEATSRDWRPKEVVETPLLREMFLDQLRTQLALSKTGFKSSWKVGNSNNNLQDQNQGDWSTDVRFSGASSKFCTVKAYGALVSQQVGIVELLAKIDDSRLRTASIQARDALGRASGAARVALKEISADETITASLNCDIFESTDFTRAQAVFDALSRQIWDQLPENWLWQEYQTLPGPSWKLISPRFDGPSVTLSMIPSSSRTLTNTLARTIELSISGRDGCLCEGLHYYPGGIDESNVSYDKAISEYKRRDTLAATVLRPTSAPTPNSSIQAEIDAVERAGRYARFPQSVAEARSGVPAAMCIQTIDNRTAYPLTLLFGGPSERALTVPSGSQQQIQLPSGVYKMVGRVPSNVLPYFGEQKCDSGMGYSSRFEIQ